MRRKRRIRFLWPLLAVVLVYVGWNGYVAARIYRYAAVVDEVKADAAVVPGAAVWGDKPSPVFAARIDHAITLYKEGTVGTLVLTGGACEKGSPPESVVARAYAIAHGVPAAAIHWEAVSRSTYGNLVEARDLAVSLGLKTLLIVTDPLHEERVMTIASDLGLTAHPAPTPTSRYRSWESRLVFLARETVCLSSYLIVRTFAH